MSLIEQLRELRDQWVHEWKLGTLQEKAHEGGMPRCAMDLNDLIQQHTHYGDWQDEIPWAHLRPEIEWVAMDRSKQWWGYPVEPKGPDAGGYFGRELPPDTEIDLEGVAMPTPPSWQESKVKRPEGL